MPAFTMPSTRPDATFGTLRASHICLRVPDYGAAKSWYCGTLDFRVVHEWPEPMIGVRMGYFAAAADDRCVIELVGDGAVPAPPPDRSDLVAGFGFGGCHHFCFTVPDVSAAVADLKARDVTIVAEPFEVAAIGRRVAFFADPFGNLFELEEVLD